MLSQSSNDLDPISSKQATSAGQMELIRSTTEVQTKILDAVSVASSTIHDDIQLLANKLEDLSIDSFHQSTTQFLSAHQVALTDLAAGLEHIISREYDLQSLSAQRQTLVGQQKIIDSLHFPLMNDRRDHVQMAHKDTCQWILMGTRSPSCQSWSDFSTWLSSEMEIPDIYWIHGKPGSGKSTLLRWIDQSILTSGRLFPWVENGSLIRAQHFFWSSGTTLQKSLEGFLRSICAQILEQAPELIPDIVQTKRWTTALLVGYDSNSMEWTETELIDALKSAISTATKSAKILILIDGLDEVEDGHEGNLERLIDLLLSLAEQPRVKLCLSSRPWNVFRDAFGACAQLRLEDFTQDDISHYVRERLQSHQRFQFIVRRDPNGANQLVQDISRKSSGVFLWVRLVVEELRAGLRDGDNIVRLSRKLDVIPADLNEYFKRMMNSIASNNRREASMILQIALHEETGFGTIHPVSLMDLSFIDEEEPTFAIQENYDFGKLNLTDSEEIQYRLESTARMLNSRCMGLLECHYDAYNINFPTRDDSDEETSQFELANASLSQTFQRNLLETPDHVSAFGGHEVHRAFNFYIDFLHRSCRDFLLSSESQELLHHYTGGPFDARTFLRSARLVQMKALDYRGAQGCYAISLASHVLSTISLHEFRALESSAAVATVIQPVVEKIAQNTKFPNMGWYICMSLDVWEKEQSSFLTLAIDFHLTSYIMNNLSKSHIQEKKGRPILDYVLQPRFMGHTSDLGIGNVWPDVDLLQSVLDKGADPNQKYRGYSVWARFLFFLMDWATLIGKENNRGRVGMRDACFGALALLIVNGVASHLPSLRLVKYAEGRLSRSLTHLRLGSNNTGGASELGTRGDSASEKDNIWIALIARVESSNVEDYPVHGILELLRPAFGDDMDRLKTQF